MSTWKRGHYSAAPSSLGYFYQCRYALLEALRRLPEGDPISISIETLDDVVFDTEGSPIDVLQTKHHIAAHTNLTDTSPELWQTLRVWIEGQSSGAIPHDSQFFLITTAVCNDGTAAAHLRPQPRDPKRALEYLSATASTSTNARNSPAYRAFSSLSVEYRTQLLESITVLDSSPSIAQLEEQLSKAVFFAASRNFLDSYISRLEGWWFGRVVAHLLDEEDKPILGDELEAESNRLRAQFQEDNLPIDDDILEATIDATGYLDRVFVEQLRLIGVNPNRVFHAIRNYYRAFEQRSRWVREDLLYVGELDRYEARLIEEWRWKCLTPFQTIS